MKNYFILLLTCMLVVSCDFTGGEQTVPQKPITQKKVMPAPEYYEKKGNTSKDSSKKPNVIPIPKATPGSGLTTLQKDSLEKAARNRTSDEQAEIERLKLKIQQLNKQTTVNRLSKSTYNIKHVDVVEGYLYEMYIKELQALKAANKNENVLSENYKKFFTTEYCDDRVLQWLDDFADKRIRSDAKRMRLKYDKVFDPDATGRQIIDHK